MPWQGRQGARQGRAKGPRSPQRDQATTMASVGTSYIVERTEISNFTRSFLIDLPPGWSSEGGPYPILVDFPGFGADAAWERDWTRWWHFQQQQTAAPFILLTPEGSGGSGDAITNSTNASLGWNVLGWGGRTSPLAADASSCRVQPQSACYLWRNPYVCYRSQLRVDPSACANGDNASATCATMSAQDDVAFVEWMLRRTTSRYHGDASRITLFGQSMGGMAAIHMARHLPADLKPAAIVPVSAGSARGQTERLDGLTHVLHLHGVLDPWAPPTVWAGAVANSSSWTRPTAAASVFARPADLLSGGDVTAAQLVGKETLVGCKDDLNHDYATVSRDGYLYDPLARTVEGEAAAAGAIELPRLRFAEPPTVPRAAAAAQEMRCATVPLASARIWVCLFEGGQ